MNFRHLLFALIAVVSFNAAAQDLAVPSFSYSHKKTSFITLKSGKKIEGKLKNLKRKKGLIKSIKLENEKGEKISLSPEEVKFMYIPQSGYDKLVKMATVSSNIKYWKDETLDQNLLGDGYVYFENAIVLVKKKERELLMQLLNTSFSSKVKIYHDPLAKESASIGVGGVSVAGGHAKSYYFSVGNEIAYKLKKKDYKKKFLTIWKGCESTTKTYADVKWKEFTKHVVHYTECK